MNFFYIVFVILISIQVQGSIGNPLTFPVGEKEVFMGNTGVAAENSAGSVYYNPASTAFMTQNKYTATAGYLGFNSQGTNITKTDNTNLSGMTNGSANVPSLLAIIIPRGEWTVSVSALQAEGRELDGEQSYQTPNYNINNSSFSQSAELWAGLTAAKRMDEQFSVGLSVFGIRRTEVSSSNSELDSISGSDIPEYPSTHLSSTYYGMAFIGGALYKFTHQFSLGLRVRSPFLQFSGSTDYSIAVQTYSPGLVDNVGTVYGADANYYFPFDTSMGTEYFVTSKWVLLADLGYQFGTTYSTSGDGVIGKTPSYNGTLRANVGSEIKMDSSHLILAGLMISPSTVDNLEGEAAGTVQETYMGGSLGLKIIGHDLSGTIGGFYYFSRGNVLETNGAGGFGNIQDRIFGGLFSVTSNL